MRTDFYITRTHMIIAMCVAAVVVAAIALILFWPNSPSTTGPGLTGTATTQKYIPPVTNTPAAASQVAKNEAVFADERVAMAILALKGPSGALSENLAQRAIAATADVSGMTASYDKGTITLRDQISINGQTGTACASFTASSLSGGATIIACPQ